MNEISPRDWCHRKKSLSLSEEVHEDHTDLYPVRLASQNPYLSLNSGTTLDVSLHTLLERKIYPGGTTR